MANVAGGSHQPGRRASSVGATIAALLAAAVLVAGAAYAVAGKRDHPSDRAAARPVARVQPQVPVQAATLAAATAPAGAAAKAATSGNHHTTARAVHHAPAVSSKVAAAPVTTSHKAPARDAALVPKATFLAVLQHKTKGYANPHAKQPEMVIPKAWYGRQSVLPILKATPDRMKVRLARRPNQATTWIKRSAATLSITYYALVIDLSRKHIYLFKRGKQVGGFPIGEGTSRTPTPKGKYFIAFHAPPNGPEYGSVMLETSAHSEVFRTFGGGNDAIIAIHGPIYSDARIANHGARISNGCIRMHERQLVKVAKVQDGTPLFIVH